MNQQVNGIFVEDQGKVSLREHIVRYAAYWPLFLICLFLSISGGILYSSYVIPKYIATADFLIKSGGTRGGDADLVEAALSGKRDINLSNEIVQVKSADLMRRAVAKNNFNITYRIKGRLHSIDIYQEAPFTFSALQLTDSNRTYELHIKQINTKGGTFLYGAEESEKLYTFQWNKPFDVDRQRFVLTPKREFGNESGEYYVRWSPIWAAAGELSGNFNVRSYDPRTSILQMSLKTENLQRGKDVLNALFKEFNLSDIEDRSKISADKVSFITDRLTTITTELKNVETDKEKFQGSHQVIDLAAQSGQSFSNADQAAKGISDINVKQRVAGMMKDYFSKPANDGKLVPTALGIDDGTLDGLLGQYNELQLKREREAPNVAPGSTVMQELNSQTSSLKSSILENLNNISRSLSVQSSNYQQLSGVSRSFLSAVPRNSNALQEIERKQNITEKLYIYLFEKREEVAISSTTDNIPHYKQIDSATGYGPVEPNKNNIIMFSAILGFLTAIGIIYILSLFNDKIVSREAIIRLTNIPLLGQIAHLAKGQKKVIPVIERNIISEQFRSIRTNLSFMIKDKSKKVIMVTSTVSGEGKSFVSLNLAAVYAIPGKKVALLEFDIRKPVIAENLQLNATRGITNYLNGEIDDITEIYYSVDELPSLHVYPCGPVMANPGDLLLAENMGRLFETLRAKYEYVIVDSPPAGLVSDPFILGAYTDTVLYVVRNQKTTRRQVEFVKEIVKDKTLNNVTLVLNDVKKNDNHGYGYGSDANYGYYNGVKKKNKYSIV